MSARNAPTDTRTQPFNGWPIGWFAGWLAAYYYYNVTPDQPAFAIGMMVGLTIAVGLTLRNPGWIFGWVLAWFVVSVLFTGGPADVSRDDHADSHSTPVPVSDLNLTVYECEHLSESSKSGCKPLPLFDQKRFTFTATQTAAPSVR